MRSLRCCSVLLVRSGGTLGQLLRTQLVSAVSALTMAIHSLTRGVEAAVQAVTSSLTIVGAEGLEQEGTGDRRAQDQCAHCVKENN